MAKRRMSHKETVANEAQKPDYITIFGQTPSVFGEGTSKMAELKKARLLKDTI